MQLYIRLYICIYIRFGFYVGLHKVFRGVFGPEAFSTYNAQRAPAGGKKPALGFRVSAQGYFVVPM